MALKETIAFAGIPNIASCATYIIKLAQEHYPLLLVSSPDNNLEELVDQVLRHVPEATVDVMACAKDSCWEADIIVVVGNTSLNKAFLDKIKAVSTQKIVVGLWLDKVSQDKTYPNQALEHLLPHSKVVLARHEEGTDEVYVDGADEEAVLTVVNMAKQLGINPLYQNG